MKNIRFSANLGTIFTAAAFAGYRHQGTNRMSIFIIILFVTAAYYLGAVLYLHRGLRSLKPLPPGELRRGQTFSIVIAARNEESCLATCLDACFAQTISLERYEVIVVNDRSTDATAAIGAEYARRFPNLTVITIDKTPDGVAPKKHAVATGITRARNAIIVLTDADCLVPKTWLATIGGYFEATTGLVQGITAYARPEGMNRLFFGLQAVDFLSHGIVAAAAIGRRMPLNSNANNFAFRKETFEAVGGYGDSARRVVSGDDDLLLQRIARSGVWQVAFMADPAGAVVTEPTKTVKGVFEQRKRWGSKTVYYTPRQVAFLSGIFLFYCALFASFFAGFTNLRCFLIFCAMLTVKIAGEFLLMLPGTALFNQKQLRPYIVPASLIQLPLVLAAVVLGVFGKFSWKGEKFARAVR
jgi:cellulose synthase/poly-beta-1,6-N-acetylglucosamine synthase-like glycosyltransferase